MERVLRPAAFLFILVMVLLLPFAFGSLLLASFAKLHLTPDTAAAVMITMLAGGFVNIPVKRIVRDVALPSHPLAIFGMQDVWPRLRRVRQETIVAVNVGGCIVPTLLAIYELSVLSEQGQAIAPALVATAVNVGVCYAFARPVPNLGIAMPAFLSPVVAASLALLLARANAAPIAFIAGVAGPLIGADLLHLRDLGTRSVGVLSIGGAGTFDGIVLSGLVAAYLA